MWSQQSCSVSLCGYFAVHITWSSQIFLDVCMFMVQVTSGKFSRIILSSVLSVPSFFLFSFCHSPKTCCSPGWWLLCLWGLSPSLQSLHLLFRTLHNFHCVFFKFPDFFFFLFFLVRSASLSFQCTFLQVLVIFTPEFYLVSLSGFPPVH